MIVIEKFYKDEYHLTIKKSHEGKGESIMTSLLLIVIYIAFISLGLPDSMLGSAWPSMYGELNVPVSYAGIVSMIIAGGTIVSSLFSDKVIRKLGTGMVTAISVAMTAVGLFGFSFSHSFWQLCLWGIPYGLGAGSVDAALNNFVALHYKAKHMSWLHCFWGVGATVGPYIMGICLTSGFRWNTGYETIGLIQVVLVIGLIISLPLWKVKQSENVDEDVKSVELSFAEKVRIPGVKEIMTAFFCYCALESAAGMWASSYMVIYKGINAETAAKWAAVFYLGITIGRFLSGFITEKIGDKNMIRGGQAIIAVGIIFMILPLGNAATFIGLIMIGIGCAPIYPCIIHATPYNFGKDKSQSIIGLQMASAYTGSTFMSPLFGVIADYTSISLYPFYLIIFFIVMVIMIEKINKMHSKKEKGLREILEI